MNVSCEKDSDGASDETAADGAAAQRWCTAVTADEVTARQKHSVHFEVHTDTTCPRVTQLLVLFQQHPRLCQTNARSQ